MWSLPPIPADGHDWPFCRLHKLQRHSSYGCQALGTPALDITLESGLLGKVLNNHIGLNTQVIASANGIQRRRPEPYDLSTVFSGHSGATSSLVLACTQFRALIPELSNANTVSPYLRPGDR